MSTEKNSQPKLEKQEDCKVSLLDLPEGVLDCILERLPPRDLFGVAQVCTCLRNRSRSDYLWEKQVKRRWGRLLGDAAHIEWQCHAAKIKTKSLLLQQNQSGSCGSSVDVLTFPSFYSHLENYMPLINLFKNCSKMALSICLESGRFWFPAQVYNNTWLYCFDALVSYNSATNTFQARSPTDELEIIEGNIQWDMLRISPVDTFPRDFYKSTCLNDLKPGDYIEIQKRLERDDPYDWWFAVVGHLESCDQDVNDCYCQHYDTLAVEFKHLPHQMELTRRVVLNKNVYEEQESTFCRFGGIRKLDKEEEIEKWNSLLLSLN